MLERLHACLLVPTQAILLDERLALLFARLVCAPLGLRVVLAAIIKGHGRCLLPIEVFHTGLTPSIDFRVVRTMLSAHTIPLNIFI